MLQLESKISSKSFLLLHTYKQSSKNRRVNERSQKLAYYKQKGAGLISTDQAVLQMKGSMFVFELWDFSHYPSPSSICCGMETRRNTMHYQKGRNK